jgi:hypothetical protein
MKGALRSENILLAFVTVGLLVSFATPEDGQQRTRRFLHDPSDCRPGAVEHLKWLGSAEDEAGEGKGAVSSVFRTLQKMEWPCPLVVTGSALRNTKVGLSLIHSQQRHTCF